MHSKDHGVCLCCCLCCCYCATCPPAQLLRGLPQRCGHFLQLCLVFPQVCLVWHGPQHWLRSNKLMKALFQLLLLLDHPADLLSHALRELLCLYMRINNYDFQQGQLVQGSLQDSMRLHSCANTGFLCCCIGRHTASCDCLDRAAGRQTCILGQLMTLTPCRDHAGSAVHNVAAHYSCCLYHLGSHVQLLTARAAQPPVRQAA